VTGPDEPTRPSEPGDPPGSGDPPECGRPTAESDHPGPDARSSGADLPDGGTAPGLAADAERAGSADLGTADDGLGGPPRTFGRRLVHEIVYGGSVTVTILAIVLALISSAILIAFSDPDVLSKFGYFFAAPSDSLSALANDVGTAYSALFKGAIVDPSSVSAAFHGGSISKVFYPISETIVRSIPLILVGLSVSLAFRAGMFNIGGQGQLLMGALSAGVVGFAIPMPPVIHVLVAIAAGFVGGAAWGWLTGYLKAETGAHEVISTIMLNYVALYLMQYLLNTSLLRRPGRTDPISPPVDPNAELPHIAGPDLRLHAGVFIALAAAAAMAWLLSRSTVGFEFRAVGFNPDAARTAGMSVSKVTIWAMLLAGGLAGLAGANQVLGTEFSLTPQIAGNYGFDGITVALLGRTSPTGTVLAGLLFGALQNGGTAMQASTSIPVDLVTVIQSLIVLFIAAPPLVRTIFGLRGAHAGGEGQTLAKGW
jgi:simple sugar transport system permease protein